MRLHIATGHEMKLYDNSWFIIHKNLGINIYSGWWIWRKYRIFMQKRLFQNSVSSEKASILWQF